MIGIAHVSVFSFGVPSPIHGVEFAALFAQHVFCLFPLAHTATNVTEAVLQAPDNRAIEEIVGND